MMAEGNLVASYNALNQPVAMIPTGSPNIYWFGYDPLGRCVKRVVGPSIESGTATYFYYDGWSLIQEGPSATAFDRLYMLGNRVDEIVADYAAANGQWMFHHSEGRGHNMLLTAANGTLAEQNEYDAFGRPYFFNAAGQQQTTSNYGNRFLFTGREWLSELKLYDYRARMYQPELGRFMQPDPKQFSAGDYNLYRYCHNDPVNRTDPTGLESPTATTWNRLMWERSGSGLSSSDFNTVRQGEAWIAPPTGNYKDNNIDHHKDPHPNSNKQGRTVYNIDKSEHVGGMLIFRPTLDWWVRADSMNTKVIAGELEHVQRWLYWQSKGDGGAFVRNFNGNHPYGFDQLRAKMGGQYDDEYRYQENNIHAHNRHVTSENPELSEKMTPEQIQNAIRNIAPQEEPEMINPYLKY
jgi:RHS repeat-associated protein